LARLFQAGQEALGVDLMSDQDASDRSGANDGNAREAASQVADKLAVLLRRSRASGFDFLAYLLAWP
jgi:hypothetical protein